MSPDPTQKATRLQVFDTLSSYAAWRDGLSTTTPTQRLCVGFVPTMGALHEGHMSLIANARLACDKVVVSIFVNPLQFAPHEDFDKYPRPLERDVFMCEAAGVDAILNPQPEEIYGAGRGAVTTIVPPEELTATMEGAFRPGFFTGVATVVGKLFNIIRPDVAYFGEKDYQQLQVIRRMVSDLNLPVTIEPVRTMRESDGLAMSSRNVYLNEEQRKLAPELHRTLANVRDRILAGDDLDTVMNDAREHLNESDGIKLQYLEACQPSSLKPLSRSAAPFVVLIAAKLGAVRLIDNIVSR
jgi:pantoate--beta-alanine ligase